MLSETKLTLSTFADVTRGWLFPPLVFSAGMLVFPPLLAAAERDARVELELVMGPGSAPTDSHRWLEATKSLPVDGVRIRNAREGERPSIETQESGPLVTYRVTGILTGRQQLIVPGKQFGIGDMGACAAWLRQLANEGPDQLAAERGAFGWTREQFRSVFQKLAARLPNRTKGQSLSQVVQEAKEAAGVSIVPDRAVDLGGSDNRIVGSELQGMSVGTGLAIALRAHQWVLIPQITRDQNVQLIIEPAERRHESWPTGWPPHDRPNKLVPKILEFVEISIDGATLEESLDVIQKRLDVPFILDDQQLRQAKIVPAEVTVKLPAGKIFYKKALDRILFPSRLRADLRVDEAQQPFLWITTIRQEDGKSKRTP